MVETPKKLQRHLFERIKMQLSANISLPVQLASMLEAALQAKTPQ